MAWWVNQSSGDLQQSGSSPGSGWVQVPGAADSDTQAQAQQQLVQDVADGAFGTSITNGIKQAANDVTGGAFGDIAQGVDALSAIGGAMHALAGALTDGTMWRSLGWLLLGTALMFLGVFMLLKGDLPIPIPV